MRRADRLFRIVDTLRGRRLTTAHQLAELLRVSERTVYRDVRDLMLSGVPIEGEAGVGYVLRKGTALPPLMFELEEIEALVLGARMVQAWSSPQLAQSAQSAIDKIAQVLPDTRRGVLDEVAAHVPSFHVPPQLGERFETARQAIKGKLKLEFVYAREDGEVSERIVRPLALHFWGERWTLVAWCELRKDFRSFRLDRMLRVAQTQLRFADERGKRLADFMKRIDREYGESLTLAS